MALNEASRLLDVHFNEPDDVVEPATLPSDNNSSVSSSRIANRPSFAFRRIA